MGQPNVSTLAKYTSAPTIDATQNALQSLGIEPKYFRPPYGDYDQATVRVAARDGLTVVLWTIDSRDWKYRSVNALEAYVEQRLQVIIGGIYLFHDIHPWTVEAMPNILDRMERGGCRFVTLSQYLAKPLTQPASELH